jgi:TonB family protein
MKYLLTAVILALIPVICAGAGQNPFSAPDQVVIDKSTRVKSLNDYVLLTRDAIQRKWRTPLELSVPGALKGRIGITYTVTRSGALESLELARGSGNREMDKSLLQAIRAAAPFPPFPDEVAARKLMIKANFIVADVPPVPITTVDLKTDQPSDQAPSAPPAPSVENSGKKFIWGTPAGSSDVAPDAPDNEIPPRPEPPKYQWGLK